MTVLYLLRSLLFYTGYAAALVLASSAMALLGLLRRREAARRVGVGWCRFSLGWARVSCGIRYEVSGREHIPPGALMVLARHESAWETLFLQSQFQPAATVLKRELLWIPFFGWALRFFDPIAINRAERANALKAVLRQGAERLQRGCRIVIFPEGTRARPGESLPFNAGGAMLAVRAGVPVLPVALTSGDCWPRGTLIKRPGLIRVVIGQPLGSAGLSAKALNAEAQAWIEAQMRVLRGALPATS